MRMPEQKPLILKVSVIRVSENVASTSARSSTEALTTVH